MNLFLDAMNEDKEKLAKLKSDMQFAEKLISDLQNVFKVRVKMERNGDSEVKYELNDWENIVRVSSDGVVFVFMRVFKYDLSGKLEHLKDVKGIDISESYSDKSMARITIPVTQDNAAAQIKAVVKVLKHLKYQTKLENF